MLRRIAPTPQFATISTSVCFPDTDRIACVVKTGLRKFNVDRLAHRSTQPSPVSVLNAAARSIARLRRSDHITDSLASLHWLRVSERIKFKLATLVYRSLHGTAPRYLSNDLRRVADEPSRRRLRSSTTHQLFVRRSRLVTIDDRAFATAGPRVWNCLPDDIVSSPSLSVFRRKIKTFLFHQSYPIC